MKRLISIILICTFMSSFLVGCSGKQSVQTTEGSKIETKEEKNKGEEDKKSDEKANETEDIYKDLVLNETEDKVTFKDGYGNEKTITKKPKNTVVLLNSILDLWYLVGGQAVARVSGTSNVPEAAKDIKDLGSFNKVSIEEILALKPNLVLMHTSNSQTQFCDVLDKNGIEWAVIDASTKAYEGFQKNAYIFSKILGTEDLFKSNVLPVVEECKKIAEDTKNTGKNPSVAILYSTSKEIKVDTDDSSIGEMVHLLGGKNIVKKEDVKVENNTRVDFSFEKLIEANPDYILISTMGNVDGVKKKIAKELESNEAWSSLNAVKNDNVKYLPKDLFVYKPNARYGEAFKYLADILFGKEK